MIKLVPQDFRVKTINSKNNDETDPAILYCIDENGNKYYVEFDDKWTKDLAPTINKTKIF